MSTEYGPKSNRCDALPWKLLQGLCWLSIPVLAVAFLLPSLDHGPEPHWRSACKNSTKEILLALHNYHDVYASLPPPYTMNESGVRLHSWRTLILPYLSSDECGALYNEVRLDEAWNSEHNLEVENRLGSTIRKFHHCQSDPIGDSEPFVDASYLAVIGPRTVWSIGRPISLGDVTDGTSNTIAVVEVADSGIHWMEPRDLYIGQMSLEVNGLRGQGVSSYHGCESRCKNAGGCHVGLLDGTYRFIQFSIAPSLLENLLTIDDGHTLGEF